MGLMEEDVWLRMAIAEQRISMLLADPSTNRWRVALRRLNYYLDLYGFVE